ncbi:PAS domain S-box protein [Methanosarcina sp.]|uniref:PAS domain S-box protein n=1 Tax=Methanosarcina sp. TaxID=2213 RepID=UPI002ABBC5C0|nr:PAS domain S-box protein [Methanosarcina sp.]MDY9927248.1 PAS domain S-box protein [Methanosarcina sp.]
MRSKVGKGQEPIPYQALLDENHALSVENHSLQGEVQSLRSRLEEAEELKRAISEGDLDALVIPGPGGDLIFTLDSADQAYRVLVETMNEGTATLAFDGTILYCNRQFAELVKLPSETVVGSSIYQFIVPENAIKFKALLKQEAGRGEINFQAGGGTSLPVYLSISSLKSEGSPNAWCLVATDLTEQKKNEEIVAAERLARSIIEQAAEAIVVCDTSGRITHFSNAVARICRCDPTFQIFENLIDIQFSEGEDAGKSILPVSSALKGSAILGVEAILELKSCQNPHQKLNFLLNSGPLKNDDGKIIGCVVTLADITERKRGEEALRESEERFRTLVAASSEVLYRMSSDWSEMRQLHSGGFLANTERPNRNWLQEYIHPEDQPHVTAIINEAIQTKGVFELEHRVWRADGSLGWTFSRAVPLIDSNGEIVEWFGFASDITERKQAEEALRESERQQQELARSIEIERARLAAVLENLPVGVWIADRNGKLIGKNKEADHIWAGKAPLLERVEEYTQYTAWYADSGKLLVSEEYPVARALLTGKSVEPVELHIRRFDDTKGTVLVSAAPIKDRQGQLTGTVGINVDITERKKTEDALHHAYEEIRMQSKELQTQAEKLNKANEALSESEALYRAIAQNFPDGAIYVFDHDLRFRVADGEALATLGYTREALENKTIWEATDEETCRILEKRYPRVLAGESLHFETKLKGHVFSSAYVPIRDEHGIVIAGMVVSHDITELKWMEAVIKRDKQHLNDILSSIQDGFFELDQEWRLTYINQRAARNSGFEPEDLIGENVWEKFPYMIGSELETVYRKVMETRLPAHIETKSLIRNQWYEVSIYPSTSGISVFWRDVTERKWAEEELREAYEQIQTQSEKLRIYNEELKTQSEELKEANEALSESEKRFRTLAENSPDIIVRFDRQKRHIYANPAVEGPYGRSPEEVIGKTQSELGRYFEQLKFLEKCYENVFVTGKPETVESQYISSQGKEYYLNTKIVPEFINGKVTSILAISRDITDIKVAEAKLKKTLDNLENLVKERTSELEEAYESLMENEARLNEAQKIAHLGNWEWDIATDKTYWSEEMYRIFGLNPQEPAPHYNEFLNYVHPDNRDYVNNNIKKAINGSPFSIDFRIISADGIERIVRKQGEVVFDEKNAPIGVKGTIQDITESKLAQQKLQQSEEKYRSFIQNFKGIAFQLDKDFNLEFIHGTVKEITGYTEEELVFGGWKQAILPEDLNLILRENKKMKSFDDYYGELDYRIKSKDGNVKWVHDIHQKIQRKGRETTYTGIVYDITEKKEAEEALAKIDKIRIKEIHHRIKNNLQVICSLLSLEADKFSDEKILEAFRESRNRVASMALIHEELYKGKGEENLNFAAYLRKLTADLFSSYSLNNNINLKLDVEQVYFSMDTAIPLGIIVNELVSNALKHAFPAGMKGEVHVNLCKKESFASKCGISGPGPDCMEKNGFHYMLTVTDDGKGIPEEIEYQDADSLGLQLINILVEQIDGCIELRRDQGTKFIIWFNNK